MSEQEGGTATERRKPPRRSAWFGIGGVVGLAIGIGVVWLVALAAKWVPAPPFEVQIGLIGAAGGALNAFLVGGELIPWPRFTREGFNLTFISTMALGAGAALAVHWFGLAASDASHQYGAALAAGVGGGSILTSISERFYANLVGQQRDAVASLAKRRLRPPTRPGQS